MSRLPTMDIASLANEYEASTWYLANIVNGLSESDLDKSVGDGWSPRQVIHHLADSEAQSYARLRRLVAEPAGSVIQGYDEALWANSPTLGYTVLPVEHSLAVYVAVREASLDIINRLVESDLEKYGVHTESGHYTVAKWIAGYSNHPRDHGNQIKEALGQ
ncbi:MAG: DinB family protein [Actinomycetota bacterium]